MVAVVDVDRRSPNLGLDPLPDIDFNIRCGNTLVGYATEEELNRDLNSDTDLLQMIANQEFKATIDEEMAKVAAAYEVFKSVQLNQAEDMVTFKHAKHELAMRLKSLNEKLNKRLHSASTTMPYEDWLKSHQPFHWLAEFYQIIQGNGGFDVIIGNPPYVEYSSIRDNYQVTNYKTFTCGNLYAFIIERSLIISRNKSIGMIVPTSSISTPRMQPLQTILTKQAIFHSTYGFRPAKLFDGGTSANIHLSIILTSTSAVGVYALNHIKWNSPYRSCLFATLPSYTIGAEELNQTYSKIIRSKSLIEKSILLKIYTSKSIEDYVCGSSYPLYYRTTGGLHYRVFTQFPTYSRKEAALSFKSENQSDIAFCIYASNLWNMFYYSCGNCLDVSKFEMYKFPIDFSTFDKSECTTFHNLARRLNRDIKNNSTQSVRHYQNTGDVECYQINMRKSKPIIDEIDKNLALHYNFTDLELDFIINYDIKYRMGDELNTEE
jgi:hypothetical protein